MSIEIHGVCPPQLAGVREAFEAVRDAGVPVCVSGAGPTLLAFPDDRHEMPSLPASFRVMPLAVRPEGFELSIDR